MTHPVLHDFHLALGARFTPVHGADIPAAYGDVDTEHRALLEGAGLLDLSARGRLVLLGSDRGKLLNGQVTNNIKDLQPGHGCYAAMVNAKARMVSDLYVHALPAELLLDLEPGYSKTVAERLEKFIVADDVQVIDAAPHYGLLSVQGRHATRAIEAFGLFPSLPASALSHQSVQDPTHGDLYLVNHPRLGHRGYDLFLPNAAMPAIAPRLLEVTRQFGGGPCGWEAFEIARIEAGIPRFGIDMDESNLPPECGIESRAISYTKGCYSGQEVIARIRTYGQVSKALRGFRLSNHQDTPIPRGTKLYLEAKEVGYLTSTTLSPVIGGRIALGYARRECNDLGTELAVDTPQSPIRATIVPLPFTDRLMT